MHAPGRSARNHWLRDGASVMLGVCGMRLRKTLIG
jgi:hypothetical protein